MNSDLLVGSICYTDLVELAKKGHSAFSRSEKNGKVYFNVALWMNDQPDKFGNTVSIQLNSSKEKRDLEEKAYIGNAKPIKSNGNFAPPQYNPASSPYDADMSDLPF